MLRRMGFEVSGKLHTIFETKQITDRFQKREFVVEVADNSRYPQTVLFQLTGDRVDAIEGCSVGDNVTVEFSLRGREWTSPKGETKFFNSLDVWKVQRDGASQGDEPPPPMEPPPDIDAEDDLPF
jgi:hypothetical protein